MENEIKSLSDQIILFLAALIFRISKSLFYFIIVSLWEQVLSQVSQTTGLRT